MKRLPRDPNKYIRSLTANRLETRVAPGVKTVTFKANMEGEEDGPYVTQIRFFGIEDFSAEPKPGFVKAPFGSEVIYFRKPRISENPVALKCSCDDFRFVWEFPLSQKNSLIGSFRRYVRKTPPPPVGLPFRNPADHPGFCKHVWNLVGGLKEKKLIRE